MAFKVGGKRGSSSGGKEYTMGLSRRRMGRADAKDYDSVMKMPKGAFNKKMAKIEAGGKAKKAKFVKAFSSDAGKDYNNGD